MIQKIKDNSTIDKKEFEDSKEIVSKVENKTLDQLEKEGLFIFPNTIKNSRDITENQMILKKVNNSYQSSNVMGFLGYGSNQLTIESRFSEGENDYFFQYLIEKVLDIPNVLELSTNSNSENQIIDLLSYIFPYYLKLALRKGVYKTYIEKKYNDNNLKGTIDVARHIKENTPFLGKISYSQREFTYDNYLMELIRHTIELISHKSFGNNLLGKFRTETETVIKVTSEYKFFDRQKIIIENQKNTVHHVYYDEYRILQKICIMILKHEKQQMSTEKNPIFGIIFDGAWLWEEYVNLVIRDIFYHPMNKDGKGQQRLFSNNHGLIYPDFVSRDSGNRIVADAKYKPINNVHGKDFLQMLAYMFRFDAKKGIYLYPEIGSRDALELWLNEGSTFEGNVSKRDDIMVIKLGIQIPKSCVNYNHFKSKMKINEEILKNRIKEYLKNTEIKI